MFNTKILNKVKALLNIDIEDDSKDFLLDDVLGDQAICIIKKYLNSEESTIEIEGNYEDALVCCIVDLYNNLESKNGSIQSKTQGQRSVSYNTTMLNNELSDRVKSMLPLPRMRLL